ncbi:hypothetical protein [Halochromatium glycolicum]|uniref:hypothetical protein n=1 Tax=Halochromatium glycolicum TaxID=85075 RepID=UPI00190B7966|nr:hypothetical protein [Halochromatium glycolicum]
MDKQQLAEYSMNTDRLHAVMKTLTDDTVLGALLDPVERALERVRGRHGFTRVLSMRDFIALGVLRHLQGTPTLREQVQALLHCDPAQALRAPLARSTWSDALASPGRRQVLESVRGSLYAEARAVLPDRLTGLPELGARPVYAMDGTYQQESAHYGRCTPRQGGEDNPKGHGLLTFYDLRLGCPVDACTETRSRHELAVLRDYDATEDALTGQCGAPWLVDRGFIDARFWDLKKRRLGVTMVTRWKHSLTIATTEGLPVAALPVNDGVLRDLRITLASSSEPWRLITLRTRRGREVAFLSNHFDLPPGCSPSSTPGAGRRRSASAPGRTTSPRPRPGARARWPSTTRCAWPSSPACWSRSWCTASSAPGATPTRRRLPSRTGATDRPDWTTPLFRYTSKVSRQVLRFFKHCFDKKASQRLYDAELRPLLRAYL